MDEGWASVDIAVEGAVTIGCVTIVARADRVVHSH